MERLNKLAVIALAALAALSAQLACTPSAAQQNPVSCTPVLVSTPDKLSFSVPAGADLVQQALMIVNKGTGDLNWAVSDNAPWIVIQQVTGTSNSAGSSVSVVIDVKNLNPGNYTGIVTVASEGALNSPVYVPVLLTVIQSGAVQPVQQPSPAKPPVVPGVSTTAVPPGESAAIWKNQTELYRYAGAYSCIVGGSIANSDAIWYMGDVQIMTQSGNKAYISDSIAPGEQVIYHRYIPCFDNEQVKLNYRWYRP
jgi:hypothetical protein